jgi:hypothetical protein
VDGVGVLTECGGVGEEGVAEVVDGEAGYTPSVGVPIDRWVGLSAQEVTVGEFSVVGEGIEGFRSACSDRSIGW